MISLYAWAKNEGIAYSHAQKLFAAGTLVGAFRDGNKITVPKDFHLPPREMVSCKICGRQFTQITGKHLQSHNITWDEYVAQFPGAKMISSEIVNTIKDANIGKPKSEITKQRISEAKQGTPAWNKGISGVYKASEETKQRMAASHIGLTHTEESKRAIGDAHRGVPETPEVVEQMRLRALEYYKTNPGPFLDKEHTAETRAVMTQKAIARAENMSPEERAEINRKIGIGGTGKVRTDEQKQTYREARCKFMSENPQKTKDTTGELTIKKRLEEKGFRYVQQFLIPGIHHPYDFFLPDHGVIIEFDGAHHWLYYWFNILGKSEEEREAMLDAQREKDAIENLAAGRAGYRIVRIWGIADVGCDEWGTFDEQLIQQGFPELV